MNRAAFLRRLSDGLAGLPAREAEDILDDYSAYFDEGFADGRSEEDVAAALGDPARLAREHNDANVLALGARLIGIEVAKDCLKAFLETEFAAGRHVPRVAKLG